MPRKILVLDGHPDPDPARYVHALADAYRQGAETAGHEVRLRRLAEIEVAFITSAADWTDGTPSAAVQAGQTDIAWAEHVVILYPLWLGALPAKLKAWLEQVLRPGFAIRRGQASLRPGLLGPRSARVVVTMGMPGWFYRLWFGAWTLRSLESNILRFSGFSPVRASVIGSVEGIEDAGRRRWLETMRELGAQAR